MDHLELLLFFSGYMLVYLVIRVLAETVPAKKIFKKNISGLLPYAYALVGILYLGFLVKSLYPDYSLNYINTATKIPLLKIWGLLSILFFIPLFAKKPVYSLLHSLVFVFFICRDLYMYIFAGQDKSVMKNDMNLYTYSLLINITAFLFVIVIATLCNRLLGKKTR
jgi:uncharacterized membrane protein